MIKYRRALLCAALSALLFFCASFTSAAPLSNQIVPIAQYIAAPGAFGLAYDNVNNRIWSSNVNGSTTLSGWIPYNSFTPAQIAGFPVVGGIQQIPFATGTSGQTTTAPNGGAQALGFFGGQLYMHTGGNPGVIRSFDPITGANLANALVPTADALISFMDGLDVDAAGNIFYSPEPALSGRDSFMNLTKFLDNTSAGQTDINPPSLFNFVTRWAGIEVVDELGRVYTVAELDGGSGRSIATYDLLGNLIAIDPDGSPFAARLEDLAFDGRYLYGTDFANNTIFVFDVVGPGGLTIPEPASMGVWAIAGIAGGIAAWRRRARAARRGKKVSKL